MAALRNIWCVFLYCLVAVDALFFHISETETRCFIEEVPDETLIVGKYKIQLRDESSNQWLPSSPGIGMHVEIKDPQRKVMLSRHYAAEGRFSVTTHMPGEHQICVGTNTTKWYGGNSLRVHLDLEVGEHAVDYSHMAEKEKLSELQLRLKQLLNQVDQISKEQAYQRVREERFRATSESTNVRVLWWSLGQTIILLVIGVWQMRHLKSFFEAKKIV